MSDVQGSVFGGWSDRAATGFVDRHVGTTAADQAAMLELLGHDSVESLVRAAVPDSIHAAAVEASVLPAPIGEKEALAELRALADRGRPSRSMIGLGYYDTVTPAVIQRNVLENPSWYTAYTPYQPEISQGRLEALINFQTMVSELTGLTTANASMLDEGTAVPPRRAPTSSSSTPTPCRRRRRCSRAAPRPSASSSSSSSSPASTRPTCPTPSACSSSTPARPASSGTLRPSSRPSTPRGASRSSPPTCSR